MGWWDTIQTLRSGKADSKKAALTMALLSAFLILVPAISLITAKPLPEHFVPVQLMQTAAAVAISIGILSFISALGILRQSSWGKRLGQSSLILLMTYLAATLLCMYYFPFGPQTADHPVPPRAAQIFAFFGYLLVVGFYAAFVFFGIRYLGRLPVKEDTLLLEPRSFKALTAEQAVSSAPGLTPKETAFHHSPFPFGVQATFFVCFVPLFLLVFIAIALKPFNHAYIVPPLMGLLFFCIFFLPICYNFLSSPFQKSRKAIFIKTAGGSIGLFGAGFPFVRVLAYEDGLEIRIFYHCYFIPYDQMKDLPSKLRFFNLYLPIRSDLPGVPPVIRLQVFGRKKFLEILHQQRNRMLAAKSSSSTPTILA